MQRQRPRSAPAARVAPSLSPPDTPPRTPTPPRRDCGWEAVTEDPQFRPLSAANAHEVAHRWMRPNRTIMPVRERMLLSAVSNGDTRLAAELLLDGVDPNVMTVGEMRALHVAIVSGCGEPMVAALVEAGADAVALSERLGTPLHAALKYGTRAAFDAVLHAAAPSHGLHLPDAAGHRPLHVALRMGPPSRETAYRVLAMLEARADPHAADGHGVKPPTWVAALKEQARFEGVGLLQMGTLTHEMLGADDRRRRLAAQARRDALEQPYGLRKATLWRVQKEQRVQARANTSLTSARVAAGVRSVKLGEVPAPAAARPQSAGAARGSAARPVRRPSTHDQPTASSMRRSSRQSDAAASSAAAPRPSAETVWRTRRLFREVHTRAAQRRPSTALPAEPPAEREEVAELLPERMQPRHPHAGARPPSGARRRPSSAAPGLHGIAEGQPAPRRTPAEPAERAPGADHAEHWHPGRATPSFAERGGAPVVAWAPTVVGLPPDASAPRGRAGPASDANARSGRDVAAAEQHRFAGEVFSAGELERQVRRNRRLRAQAVEGASQA